MITIARADLNSEIALSLYEAAGFGPIPLYGEYCLSPDTSVCLGKSLLSQGSSVP